jgi:hypothetical protein
MNAATHCLTVTRQAAQMGDRKYRRLPKKLRYIQDEAGKWASTQLERCGTDVIDDEAWEALQTASAWELHRLNVLRDFRTSYDALTPDQRLHRTAEQAKAMEKRCEWAKRFRSLCRKDEADPWATLHVNGQAPASEPEGNGRSVAECSDKGEGGRVEPPAKEDNR